MDQGKSDSNEVNNNNDHVSTDLSASSLNEVMIPKIDMTFISEDEVRNFYKSYAQNVGFGISKLGGKKGDDGKQKYFCFGCGKSGKTVSQVKNALYPRPSIKTNCKAKINVVIRNDDNFVISSVSLEHNHVLSPGKSRHFRFEAGGYENLTFDERKCRNYISKARRLSEDSETFIWLFKSWLTCMLGRAPKAIITDQCRAMAIAIEEIFPDSHHQNNDWLKSLYEQRNRWIPVYVKDKFWAGHSFCDNQPINNIMMTTTTSHSILSVLKNQELVTREIDILRCNTEHKILACLGFWRGLSGAKKAVYMMLVSCVSKLVEFCVMDPIAQDAWKRKFSSNAFIWKLLTSSIRAKPLQINYDKRDPNSVFSWLDRWTTISFSVPTAKSNRRINLKGQTNRAMEIESGKSRCVQNNSASNTATGLLTNTNNEPEKAKRNMKKANSSLVHNKTKDDINVKY
ncbi:hypothetical protein ZIOFF_056816 [Zingiber officinale]|uniref:Protein FAR1-RELATED SEQUENCE n=1 Tax=Zingiber officinale TaxID=94328 RepID=A0A8J5KL79_ZINOF|nr:hypothetical protein ZIOFF_056816 [Zingiber officinale]